MFVTTGRTSLVQGESERANSSSKGYKTWREQENDNDDKNKTFVKVYSSVAHPLLLSHTLVGSFFHFCLFVSRELSFLNASFSRVSRSGRLINRPKKSKRNLEWNQNKQERERQREIERRWNKSVVVTYWSEIMERAVSMTGQQPRKKQQNGNETERWRGQNAIQTTE